MTFGFPGYRQQCIITNIASIYVYMWYAICIFAFCDPWMYMPENKTTTAWWRHQMATFSAKLALRAGNSPVPVNSPHKGQWRGALMFSLICVWINDWVNNREAGDLRRHRGHYDVNVMATITATATATPTATSLWAKRVHLIKWYIERLRCRNNL